jgi:hypothetical protein
MGGESEVPVSFDSLRDKNLMQLKKLNIAIFPVRYNEKYYADALSSGDFTKLGKTKSLHHFIPVLFCFSMWNSVVQHIPTGQIQQYVKHTLDP